ncbi:regulator of G-protein signaling rgs-2-like isoform X1 [Rhopilema esculentum]|uniref:regulator of G-protein signaling rgs-2-like isoform X1 n=2 Tax=Rhopilema esculentum TaxID=499914 RepID=UPI0031D6AE1C
MIILDKSMGGCSSTVSPESTADVKAENKSDGRFCKCCQRESGTENAERFVSSGICTPCKEEAKSWSASFDKLMESPVGRKLFQEFLQSQYSDENLRFWLAADDYQSRSPDERKETARKVYEDFISTISPCEVSIDAKLRAHIEDNLDSGDPDLFLNAKNYIYNLMSLDCFPRFIKSKYYKNLCK